MQRHRLVTASVLTAAVLLFSLPVHAQEGQAEAPGDNGIKIGAGRLHPFLELEGRFDSNALYYVDTHERVPDISFHVRPGFKLQVPGHLTQVDFSARLDWNSYLGMSDEATRASHLFADANLGVAVNREGLIGLDFDDAFHRSDRTATLSLGTAVVSLYNDLKLGVPIRPGGGALILKLGGQWTLESFEAFDDKAGCAGDPACDPDLISRLGYNQIAGTAEARWKFLPHTALVFDALYFVRAPRDTAVATRVSGLKLEAGVNGLVTSRLAVTVKAGYGDTFGSAGQAYRTWLANVEAEYFLSEMAAAKLGYEHSYFADAGQAFALYEQHRVYLDGKMLLAGQFTLHGEAEWSNLRYVLVDDTTSQLVKLAPGVDYELMRWIVLGLGYDFTYRTTGGAAAGVPGFNFTKHEVWLRATFTY